VTTGSVPAAPADGPPNDASSILLSAITSASEHQQIAKRATMLALRVGALYLVVGMTWVLLSDWQLEGLSPSASWLSTAQSAKGAFFVVLTAIGLTALVRRSHLSLLSSVALGKFHALQTKDLFAQHPQPMWVVDRQSLAFLSVNGAAVEHYGYSESEFLSRTLKDINPPEDRALVDERAALPVTGPQLIGNVRHVKKSGEVIWARVSVHPVQYGGRTAIMAMAIDVTSEVLAANALQRQEAQFRQLHQSLCEVLWLANAANLKVVYVSRAFEEVYGRPCAELLANPSLWMDVVLPEDRVQAETSDNQLRTLGHTRCEYRIVRPDGSVRWISDRKNVIKDSEGLVTLIGGIAEDITAQKELEAERANQKVQLELLVAHRTAELAAVNVELEAFTRSAAHDLKSPLNGIVGFCHLLNRKHGQNLGHDALRMVGKIELSARNMETLVNDLLMLSRVGAKDLDIQRVDLAQIAHEVFDELLEGEPGRRIEFDAPPELPVWLDPGLAKSLLSNLLGNAWKFTHGNSVARIRLTAERSGESTLVGIHDNGAGFDSTIAPKLFKPFQRFHALNEFHGSGVGLVTCQRIVHRHGGELRIASSPGAGTSVTFTIPPSPSRS